MIRTVRLLIALSLLAAVAVSPLSAQEAAPCTDPVTGESLATQQPVFLHPATTKAGNLAALGLDSFPSWDATAPSQSVRQGAGGGYAGNSANFLLEDDPSTFGLTAEGTAQGCLDAMLFDLYAFMPTNRTGSNGDLAERAFTGIVTVDIDGEQVVFPLEFESKTVPNPSGSATYRIRFAITGIESEMKALGMETGGEHEIRVNVSPRYLNTDNAIFVYDTTEVPAGITFNGTPDETYAVLPL